MHLTRAHAQDGRLEALLGYSAAIRNIDRRAVMQRNRLAFIEMGERADLVPPVLIERSR